MHDTTIGLIAYFAVVLALVAYLAANVGAERRDYRRHRGWMAVTGGFLGVAVAAVALMVAV